MTTIQPDEKPSENDELPVNPIFAVHKEEPAPIIEVPAQEIIQTPLSAKTIPAATATPELKKGGYNVKYLLFGLAAAIPLALIIYILYWNILPLGSSNIFILTAGSLKDTSGELYFLPSKNLSERKSITESDGKTDTYRELYGPATIAFKPKAIFKNAQINVTIDGDNILVIPSEINLDPASIGWDYNWDFTTAVPAAFSGEPFAFDGCTQFDGSGNKLQLADSKNIIEQGPFSVYVEWTPEDGTSQQQEIIGHYNWEIFQSANSVQFHVGRVNNKDGVIYSVSGPVNSSFFNNKHSLIAIYSPAVSAGGSGYIELLIDNKFVGRTSIGEDIIWPDYGQKMLTLGKSDHEGSTNFKGCVYTAKVLNQVIIPDSNSLTMKVQGDLTSIPISNTNGTGTIRSIKVEAHEE